MAGNIRRGRSGIDKIGYIAFFHRGSLLRSDICGIMDRIVVGSFFMGKL